MNQKKIRLLGISLLILLSFACSLFSSSQEDSSPPTLAPTQPATVPSLAPTPLPTQPSPIGVAAKSNGGVALFDREGYTLVQVNAAGIADAGEENIHIAGRYTAESGNLPIVYFSFEQNNAFLFSNQGQLTTLLSVPDFARMVGVPGEAILAYSTTEYLADGVGSSLYVGSVDTLPVAAPVFYEKSEDGWSLDPLAVKVENGQPVGVWYSKYPNGIGGDIVFDPRRALFYLDLRTDTSSQLLGTEANPSALSADQTWLAYTNEGAADAGVGTMTVKNLATGVTFSYPLQQVVDSRGAGDAVFSPENSYLAWMEGSGWQMSDTPNFHSTIRVGDLNGNLLFELADSAFATVSGLGSVGRVEPVGWLDEQTLVVMVRGEDWISAALVMVDIPTQAIRFLARGSFVGMVYP